MYAGVILRPGGDGIGDLLVLDRDLEMGASRGGFQPRDLGARLRTGHRIRERLAGPVRENPDVIQWGGGRFLRHLRLLGAGADMPRPGPRSGATVKRLVRT